MNRGYAPANETVVLYVLPTLNMVQINNNLQHIPTYGS